MDDQPGPSKKYSTSRRMSEGSNEPNPNDGRPNQLPTGTQSEPATPSIQKPSLGNLFPTLSRRSSSISSYLRTDSTPIPNTHHVSPVRPHPAAAASQDREAALSFRELHLYPQVIIPPNPPTPTSSDASPARINQHGQIIYNERPEPPLSEEQQRRINEAADFVQPQPSAAAYGSPLHRPTTSERAEQMQANLRVPRLREDGSYYQVIPITNVEVVDLRDKPERERRCCLMRGSNIFLIGLGLFVITLLVAGFASQSDDAPQNVTVTKSMRSPKVFGDSNP